VALRQARLERRPALTEQDRQCGHHGERPAQQRVHEALGGRIDAQQAALHVYDQRGEGGLGGRPDPAFCDSGSHAAHESRGCLPYP
jgi:hypothetical protein